MNEIPTGIENIAPDDLMTDVGSDVTLAALAAALFGHGLFWPPALLADAEVTVGDFLARAPGGHTRLGSTVRRYVLAIDARLADGQVMRAGARTVKCVTGYDLKQLFIGSRGCLGTILGATLRLEAEANRAAVERRLEEDFAGLEGDLRGREARGADGVSSASIDDGSLGDAGPPPGGRSAAPAFAGWRDVLAMLKQELDPEGRLPSIEACWPEGGSPAGERPGRRGDSPGVGSRSGGDGPAGGR